MELDKSIDNDLESAKSSPDEGAPEDEFKYIVRIADTNINGHSSVELGLAAIPGVGVRLGTIIVDLLALDRTEKMGNLSDEIIEKLEETVETIDELVPRWLLNRRNDFDMGEDYHICGRGEMTMVKREDLNRLKKIRCYRGIRHEQGQKVRGQRTRSNGRTGLTMGVIRKETRQRMAKQTGKSGRKSK